MSDTGKKPKVAIIGTGAAAAAVLATLARAPLNRAHPASSDPVTTPATIAGKHGRAWLVDMEAWRARHARGREDAGVASWVVEAEYAHPIWHSYLVMLVHLRPYAGGQPPVLYRPDATHEFWVFALESGRARQPVIAGEAEHAPLLHPMNFGAQLAVGNDAAAMELIEAAVTDVTNALLSPDTDHFSAWAARFGDAMVRKDFKR